MFALLGSIIGFLGSALPSVLKMFQDHKDKRHEIELLRLQIENSKVSVNSHLEEVRLQTQAMELSSLYSYQFVKTDTWVDAFASTVRPVITYMFFSMYIAIKLIFLYKTLDMHSIWTEQDEIIFATLISFWFGNRTLNGKQYIQKK